ncbi:MAG: hypothetical protein ACKVX7_13805 [Planctomycetota bacterium]
MAVTGRDGSVSVEAPLGKVHVTVGKCTEEVWVGAESETVLEFTY